MENEHEYDPHQLWRVWHHRSKGDSGIDAVTAWKQTSPARHREPAREFWIPYCVLVALTLLIVAAGVLG